MPLTNRQKIAEIALVNFLVEKSDFCSETLWTFHLKVFFEISFIESFFKLETLLNRKHGDILNTGLSSDLNLSKSCTWGLLSEELLRWSWNLSFRWTMTILFFLTLFTPQFNGISSFGILKLWSTVGKLRTSGSKILIWKFWFRTSESKSLICQ